MTRTPDNDPEHYVPVEKSDGSGQIRTLGFEVDGPRLSIHLDLRGFQMAGLAFALAGAMIHSNPEFAAKVLTDMTIRPMEDPTVTDDDVREALEESMPNMMRFIEAVIEGINETMHDLMGAFIADAAEDLANGAGDE